MRAQSAIMAAEWILFYISLERRLRKFLVHARQRKRIVLLPVYREKCKASKVLLFLIINHRVSAFEVNKSERARPQAQN